eukprot:TRINITY_DN25282_c0_g1_i1.p3 TRINITY_DN25282_c0_g1~~TRINITY_DN25282_c0_g1_i1.p3  ORF type:complete len:122 (+),score=41.88 TRINITY_DN25282_c0_g1_i1:603-968(+)
MQGLTEAAEALGDPIKRRKYDLTLQYHCDEEYKETMGALPFASVTIPSGGHCGVAFGNMRGDECPSLRAVQTGSAAEAAGLGRFVGRRIAFACMQRTTGWTGQTCRERLGQNRILVFHFWP